MNRVQEQEHHLALANRQIAELTVQIVRQRVIVKHVLDTGQHSAMVESLLDALEGSLRIFEKHRILVLSLQRISSSALASDATNGRSCHDTTGMERHDKDGPSRLVATAEEDRLSLPLACCSFHAGG